MPMTPADAPAPRTTEDMKGVIPRAEVEQENIPTLLISAATLSTLGVHPQCLARFREVFGDGEIAVTAESYDRAVEAGLNIGWLLRRWPLLEVAVTAESYDRGWLLRHWPLLDDNAWGDAFAEYCGATADKWREFERVTHGGRAESTDAAIAEFERVTAPVLRAAVLRAAGAKEKKT